MMPRFAVVTLSSFFFFLFLLTLSCFSSQVQILLQVLCQYLYQLWIRNCREIRKQEIHPSKFCPISGDWDQLEMQHLIEMSLIKGYLMLQNSRLAAFTFSELLRENQQGSKNHPQPPRLRLKLLQFYTAINIAKPPNVYSLI